MEDGQRIMFYPQLSDMAFYVDVFGRNTSFEAGRGDELHHVYTFSNLSTLVAFYADVFARNTSFEDDNRYTLDKSNSS